MQNIFSSFQKTINILTVETPFGELVVQSNLLSEEDVATFKKHFENVKTEEEFAYLYEKLQELVLKQPEVKVPFQEGFDILQELTKDFKGFGDFEKVFQQEDIHKQFDGLTKEFGNMFDLHTVIFKTKPESEQSKKEEEKPFSKVQVDKVEEEVKEVKEVQDSVEMSDIDREIARLQKLKAEREKQKEAENRLIQRKELTLEINKLVAELESKKVDLLNVFDNPEVRETTYQEMKNLDSKIKSLQSKLDEF